MRSTMVIMVAAFLLAACGSGGSAAWSETTGVTNIGDGGQPAGRDGGQAVTSTASCIEEYSWNTLPNRRFAFDGTVTEIEVGAIDEDAGGAPADVTYAVNEWFAGGSSATVTLRSWDFIVDGSSGDPALDEGTRLLVSGDTDMAWGCGFTRPYDSAEAGDWAATFAQ